MKEEEIITSREADAELKPFEKMENSNEKKEEQKKDSYKAPSNNKINPNVIFIFIIIIEIAVMFILQERNSHIEIPEHHDEIFSTTEEGLKYE